VSETDPPIAGPKPETDNSAAVPEHTEPESADESKPESGLQDATLEFEDPGERPVDPGEFDYKVQLDIFEGPLDLLLYLIKRDEIDIYDISIDRITKQYMEYLDAFRLLNIGLAGEFLVMAANLCYIKSRTMLPKHVQPPEEDAEEEDPRWDLIRQLIEYKKFKDAANFLQHREVEQQSIFRNIPEAIEVEEGEERPLAEVSIFDLIRAFQNVLKRFEDEDSLNEIYDDRWTVGDKIDHLLKKVEPGHSMKFSALFEAASSKGEVIVTFLALLELMKLNHFRVQQDTHLGEIELQRSENS